MGINSIKYLFLDRQIVIVVVKLKPSGSKLRYLRAISLLKMRSPEFMSGISVPQR